MPRKFLAEGTTRPIFIVNLIQHVVLN